MHLERSPLNGQDGIGPSRIASQRASSSATRSRSAAGRDRSSPKCERGHLRERRATRRLEIVEEGELLQLVGEISVGPSRSLPRTRWLAWSCATSARWDPGVCARRRERESPTPIPVGGASRAPAPKWGSSRSANERISEHWRRVWYDEHGALISVIHTVEIDDDLHARDAISESDTRLRTLWAELEFLRGSSLPRRAHEAHRSLPQTPTAAGVGRVHRDVAQLGTPPSGNGPARMGSRRREGVPK
jgi:hypothetical protein